MCSLPYNLSRSLLLCVLVCALTDLLLPLSVGQCMEGRALTFSLSQIQCQCLWVCLSVLVVSQVSPLYAFAAVLWSGGNVANWFLWSSEASRNH